MDFEVLIFIIYFIWLLGLFIINLKYNKKRKKNGKYFRISNRKKDQGDNKKEEISE